MSKQQISKINFIRVLVAVVLFGLVTMVGANESSMETDLAVLKIVPISGEPSTKLTIYGAGFDPGEKVRVILKSGHVPLQLSTSNTGGIVTANENGAFKLVPRGGIPKAPLLIKPGVYSITAFGDKGAMAAAPLEVLEKKQ